MWHTVKAVLRRKFIAENAYFRKKERPEIKKSKLYLEELEKGEKAEANK